MAESTVILRPVSDISMVNNDINHDLFSTYPENATSLYLLVNEEVADDDSTYIRQNGTEARSTDTTCIFGIDTSAIPANCRITKINMYIRTKVTSANGANRGYLSLVVNGIPYVGINNNSDSIAALQNGGISLKPSSTTVYETFSDTLCSEGIDAINTFISANKQLPQLQYELRLYTYQSGSQGKTNSLYFTQCYVEIIYEEITGLNIHRKVSGVWVQAQSAYQKQNGTWVEITEDECKGILQSSLVTKGG